MSIVNSSIVRKTLRVTRKTQSVTERSLLQISLFLIAVTAPVTIISGLLATNSLGKSEGLENIYRFLTTGEWLKSFTIVFTSIFFSVVLVRIFESREHRQIYQIFRGSQGKKTLGIFALSVVVGGGVAVVSSGGNLSFLKTQPGGTFDIFMGIISVAGIYITFGQVLDVHNSIVSFRDFLNRIEDLILDTEPADSVSMMIWTPAMGSLALDERIWKRVWRLAFADPERNITLTCLNQEDMKSWFNSYLKDCTDLERVEKERRIEDAVFHSNNAIELLKARYDYKIHEAEDQGKVTMEAPVFGNLSQLPQTYMIANKARAIVAVPLFLPTPTYNPYTQSQMSNNVQFIGFETKNYHLVESVHEEIKARRAFLKAVASPTQADESEPVEDGRG